MPSINRIIWTKLGIHRGDTLPFNGMPWNQSNRGTIAEIFAALGHTKGAEVGVELGKYSRLLCDTVPGLRLLCVDPWRAYNHNSTDREEKNYQNTLIRLAGCNVEIIRKTSLEASLEVPDGSLDFVYIDALHEFDNVMMDIILWSPKVRSGGIISGHDYVPYFQFGVIQAVQAYTLANNIGMWYVTTEPIPSFLWVKP